MNKNLSHKQIYILSKVKNKNEENACKKLYEKIDFTLPFLNEINEQFERKELFEKMSWKKVEAYESALEKINEVIYE